MLQGHRTDLVEVDALVAAADAVVDEVVEDAAGVHRRAVREMAAVVEAEAEDGVAGLEEAEVHRHVGAGPRVRLHVRMVGTEQFLHPLDGKRLDIVDDRVAAVVALARVALGVLVGEHRTRRAHHVGRGEVLAGDELQARVLADALLLEEVEDLGVVVVL